jgi:ankyrin repeat protein
MWAAAEGHSDVVKLLIDAGADVKAASKGGFNALLFAATKDDAKSVASLVAAGTDPNYGLPDGTKALSIAVTFKGTNAAEALLDAGANPNVADKQGTAPLHTAAQLGDIELVKKLLAKGANPNARTGKAKPNPNVPAFFRQPGEQTPVMMAARANHEDVMKLLLAGGADPALKADDGTTLLMSSVGSGHVEIVKFAYTLDKNVKAVTTRGSTLMHAAVTGTTTNSTQKEVCEVVQFLADIGAPLDEKDGRGRTPMDVANVLPIDKAVDLLTELIVKSGAEPKSKFKR